MTQFLVLLQQNITEQVPKLIYGDFDLFSILLFRHPNQILKVRKGTLWVFLYDSRKCRYSIRHSTLFQHVQVEFPILVLLQALIKSSLLRPLLSLSLLIEVREIRNVILNELELGLSL